MIKFKYPVVMHPAVTDNIRQRISLDGNWRLRLDPDNLGAQEEWGKDNADFEYSVKVPGAIWAIEEFSERYPSFKQPNDYKGGCWYQCKFNFDTKDDNGKIWLKFGGVSPTAHIWLNGNYLGFHQYPLVGFKCDITEQIISGQENVLTLELTRWSDLDDARSIVGGLYFGGPGIYHGVGLEQTGELRFEDLFIRSRIDEQEILLTAILHNDTAVTRKATIQANVTSWSDDSFTKNLHGDLLLLEPGKAKPVSIKMSMEGCRLWSPEEPFLYQLKLEALADGIVIDAVVERFGMRSMAIENEKLVLNHEPLMWRTSSPEYINVPTISAPLDKEFIRRRIQTMKELGFNGNRLHTHIYPREALDICDELGFLLQVEPPVISNFNELTPYPENRPALIGKVKEVRNHPSVVVICLGNENSQIMNKPGNKERAKVHLDDIRELVPDHMLLTGCGYQGEFPDVYNAFQTPHLWSRNFKWAHEGLSAVPWAALKHLFENGPIVLHEYGKYTVWPDPEEDQLFRKYKMPLFGNYGEMGMGALKDAGIDYLLPEIIDNSRKLAAACTKIALEQPRRLPGMQGYHYHCVLRVGNNRGFVDDLGCKIDPQFQDIKNSNDDTVLLIDRDYRWRSMQAGTSAEISFFLSHFGRNDLTGATLEWKIEKASEIVETGEIGSIIFSRGKNDLLGKIKFIVPSEIGKFQLSAVVADNSGLITRNSWFFWSFPYPARKISNNTLIAAKDFQWEFDLMAHFPSLRRADEFITAYNGFNKHKYADALDPELIKTIISDQWTDEISDYVSSGGTVILLDRNNFPSDWYAEPDEVSVSTRKPYCNIYKLFTPFRSGWDYGNAATVIHDHPLLGDFPHEGWCDLNFFDLVEGANSLKTNSLPGSVEPVARVIPIARLNGGQLGPAPSEDDCPRRWTSENRCYLAETGLGRGRLIICSLNLNNTAGGYLLEQIINYAENITGKTSNEQA